MTQKILFICKHNRFRSKVAEVIFNKLNKNKQIKAESAGLVLDEAHPYISKNVIKIMREKGYKIKGKPKQATLKQAKKFNLIIFVADNINKEFFSSMKIKIIQWKIPDCNAENIPKIKRITNQIEAKVKSLIKKLNKTT